MSFRISDDVAVSIVLLEFYYDCSTNCCQLYIVRLLNNFGFSFAIVSKVSTELNLS